MVLICLEEKRSNKIEIIQYLKKLLFLSTSLRISRPNQKHMKPVEFQKKDEITGSYLAVASSPSPLHCGVVEIVYVLKYLI
jgi:hypothetical protein